MKRFLLLWVAPIGIDVFFVAVNILYLLIFIKLGLWFKIPLPLHYLFVGILCIRMAFEIEDQLTKNWRVWKKIRAEDKLKR